MQERQEARQQNMEHLIKLRDGEKIYDTINQEWE